MVYWLNRCTLISSAWGIKDSFTGVSESSSHPAIGDLPELCNIVAGATLLRKVNQWTFVSFCHPNCYGIFAFIYIYFKIYIRNMNDAIIPLISVWNHNFLHVY